MKCIGIDQSPTSKNFKQLCQTVKQPISKDIYSPHRIANKKIAEAFEVIGFQFFHFKLWQLFLQQRWAEQILVKHDFLAYHVTKILSFKWNMVWWKRAHYGDCNRTRTAIQDTGDCTTYHWVLSIRNVLLKVFYWTQEKWNS